MRTNRHFPNNSSDLLDLHALTSPSFNLSRITEYKLFIHPLDFLLSSSALSVICEGELVLRNVCSPLAEHKSPVREEEDLKWTDWKLSRLPHLSFVNALDLIIRLPAQQGGKQVMSCYQFIQHDKVITAINEHVLWNGGVANWNAGVWDALLAERSSNEDDGKSNMKEDKCLHCSFVPFTS